MGRDHGTGAQDPRVGRDATADARTGARRTEPRGGAARPAGAHETNQRREPRVPLHAPVRISTIDPELDPGTGRPFFRSSREFCSNVSRTGLFIHTAEPLEPGRRLLVELTLPGGDDVDAVGRVAWVKRSLAPGEERGVGIELLGAGDDELARLQRWIASCKGRDGVATRDAKSRDDVPRA